MSTSTTNAVIVSLELMSMSEVVVFGPRLLCGSTIASGVSVLVKVLPEGAPVPLPSSFLVDGQGRLTVIYKGTVSVDELLADARHSGDTLAERRRRGALLPGRLSEDEYLIQLARMKEVRTRFKMAEALRKAERTGDAIAHYR